VVRAVMYDSNRAFILAANKTFGGDPLPRQPKVLTLTFIHDGKTQHCRSAKTRRFSYHEYLRSATLSSSASSHSAEYSRRWHLRIQ